MIERVRALSRYLDQQLATNPALLKEFDLREVVQVSALQHEDYATQADLMRALRCLRRQVMVRLIVRDLAGWATLAEVTAAMTELAQTAIACTLDWLTHEFERSFGTPVGASGGKPQQLLVVGMGKLGGGELNVSSDIDLIFIYPEEGDTSGPRSLSNHEYFTRLGRALIGVLSELTEDGYVFRVDMRLRPYGDSGPLVASFGMLENYLITQGREWERYAWIKGRVLTGDRGGELMDLVRPFVFRRHLDYSAFASMRDLHAQIRREVARREIAGNIKLGPGGIREIEFIAQVFQLIRGGRDAALRRQPTLEVLALLPERNLMPAEAVAELTQAYEFLRKLEHRLQYLDDRQTHVLPADAADQTLIARAMGYADFTAFNAELERQRLRVSRHFDEIFAAAPAEQHRLAGLWHEGTCTDGDVEQLGELGFRQPRELCERLVQMRDSARYRQMPAASQARLDRLAPLAIENAAAGREPDATLERMLRFLEAVSRRVSYLALLEEYPQARQRLADFMRSSPWIADYLTQHPILLDELLDARTLYTPPDWSVLTGSLHTTLDDAAGDAEKQMDILRHFKHAQTLRLVAQDLAGMLPLETLADHLSDLACVVLREVLRLAWLGVRQRHRESPAFAIVGYGKLGGKELGYASDLDLVFLHDDEAPEAPENYARLAQRIVTWLTSATAAGVLYDTDLRLRPDGAAGMLVSSLAAFREYQTRHAWVWEHQALTRARAVAGDAAIGQAFESLRIELLRKPRELPALRNEIAAMRQKMHDAHPNTSGLFDLKHDPGGIIDVEFMVQYLVLGHAHAQAALTGNIGNLALLKLAGELELISADLAERVRIAYREYRRLQHGLRLQGERYARVARESQADGIAAVRELWQQVFPDHAAKR